MTALLTYEQRPSPNHGHRVGTKPVDILLLHYTGMESEEGALAWLTNPAVERFGALLCRRGRPHRPDGR